MKNPFSSVKRYWSHVSREDKVMIGVGGATAGIGASVLAAVPSGAVLVEPMVMTSAGVSKTIMVTAAGWGTVAMAAKFLIFGGAAVFVVGLVRGVSDGYQQAMIDQRIAEVHAGKLPE